MKPKRIFLDTEFTSFHRTKLISIGLVCEDDEMFYCEVKGWPRDEASDFVKAVVMPLLSGKELPREQIAERLTTWLADRGPCIIATDSMTFDWALMNGLLGGKLPENVEKQPLILSMNYLHDYETFEKVLEQALGPRRHHALNDAQANRIAWLLSGKDTL